MVKNNGWTPELRNGVCLNGCLPLDEISAEVQGRLLDSAVGIEYDWQHQGNMKIVKWNDQFETWLDERIELVDALTDNGVCLMPWEILKNLPADDKNSNRLYWSQGGIGSCMSHSNTFAYQCATLIEIALGAPLIYHSFNPIVPFYLSKGGSLRGGQTVSVMSAWTNEHGQYSEDWVGEDNQSVPDNYEEYEDLAVGFQNGLCFVESEDPEEITEKIFRACHAGLSWSFGNSHAVRGAKEDENGVKVAVLGGLWKHATSFSGYRIVNGTEYIFWQNSHLPEYGQSEEGEPAYGAYMPRSTVGRFCRSMALYGYPYVHFVEGDISSRRQLNAAFKCPFPENWKR